MTTPSQAQGAITFHTKVRPVPTPSVFTSILIASSKLVIEKRKFPKQHKNNGLEKKTITSIIILDKATTMEPSINITATTETSTPKSTNYSYRNRADIKTPTAFPVSFSPLRNRSTKRTSKGYKTTTTVTMPAKVKSDGVSKSRSLSTAMTAEQKAAIRAMRFEARRFAKETQSCEAVEEDGVDGDVDMDDKAVRG